MRDNLRRIAGMVAVLMVSQGMLLHAAQDERVISIRELMDVKEKWPLFAENKIRFTVRGRVGSRTNEEIHMRKCELRFLLKSKDNFPKLKPGSFMIKFTGHFDLNEKTPVFRVSRVYSEFSQENLHSQKSVDMKTTDPKAWRKLATYTAAEAKFYDDEDLFRLAAEAYEHAYRVERTTLENESPEQIQNWITQMKTFGVSADAIELWEHELFQIRWRKIKNEPKENREAILRLASDISQKYPQALTPLEVDLPKLEASYQADPVKLFHESDQKQQDRLWRLFYRSLMTTEILARAKPSGENAAQVRKELQDAVPDDPELIQSYDQLSLDWRFSQLDRAGRDEAVQLSSDYRQRNLPDRAREALKLWIDERLKTWKREGAAGYVRAARESVNLLEDREWAYELLEQAWKLSPGENEIEEAFASIGYRRHSGKWITTVEYEKLPPDPIEVAIQKGSVLEGMTPHQVRRSVGSARRKQISFSAGHISEAWIYGEKTQKQLVVHFLRASHLPVEQGKVIAIGELPQATNEIEEIPAE